ncbi:hypothetical protein WMF38_33265 [Sorangium sp. So ce118]
MPCYIVETSDDRALRTVFHRTNVSGRPLEEPEVFDALLGAGVKDGGARVNRLPVDN